MTTYSERMAAIWGTPAPETPTDFVERGLVERMAAIWDTPTDPAKIIPLADRKAQREKTAAELRFNIGAEGDAYLNFYAEPVSAGDSVKFVPVAQIVTGPYAKSYAASDARDEDEPGNEPKHNYRGTIVLHPDGTWEPVQFFRL